MTRETEYDELFKALKESLLAHKFIETEQDLLNDISFLEIYKTRRIFGCQYLCVVTEVPESIIQINEIQVYFNQVRKALTKKYAKFPYWKELGTYLVILCENDLYKKLQKGNVRFKDLTGFHMNVMLGTCIINKNTFENSSESTWGLFYSGRYYETISNVVSNWCRETKQIE